MTMSSSTAGTGHATPNLGGVAGQGGELFKGFSALGNKVRDSRFLFIYLLDSFSRYFSADRSPERGWPRESHLGCKELSSH